MHDNVGTRKEKVLFYQEYICPTHEDPREKPFMVIIPNGFMMDIAKIFSSRNSWAFDSTFKTNQGENIIVWCHKEHHTLIFQDPSNFGKI
jgi:hypothetical protein